jgi:hypothetical protein
VRRNGLQDSALDTIQDRLGQASQARAQEAAGGETRYAGDADLTDEQIAAQPFPLYRQGLGKLAGFFARTRAVGLERLSEGAGQCLVQDQQVDLVGAELAGALVEAVQCLVVAVVADPDLGLQQDGGAAGCGGVHGLAYLALVAVGGGGVDVPVAGLQRRGDRRAGVVRRCLEHAEADCGQFDAVVQRDTGDLLAHD